MKNNTDGIDANVYVTQIEDVDELDKIEDLQSHENIEACKKGVKIFENYFVEKYEDEMLATSHTPWTTIDFSTYHQTEVPPICFNFM
jgi:hypothetical protein